MKCPQCQANQRQRDGMTCKVCDYTFTLNPRHTTTGHLTDGKLLAAIKRASNSGKDYFTFNQLYAAHVSLAVGKRGAYVASLVILPVLIVIVFQFWGSWALLGLLPFPWLIYYSILNPPKVISRQQFHSCLQTWRDRGRTIKGLIENPILHDPPPQWAESDIYAYGVERILIVQRELLVDLFVLNNLHSEHRMVVVSLSGYPDYVAKRIPQLLEENPQLPIFLLHDADELGRKMRQQIDGLEWLPIVKARVIDLGFFPDDFVKLKRTRKLQLQSGSAKLPADAVLTSTLSLGLGACLLTQTTFATELTREKGLGVEVGGGGDFG